MIRNIKAREVTRPTPDPLKSSILDHATVVDMAEGFGLRNEAGMWPSYNCLDMLVPTPLCPEPLVEPETAEPKTFVSAPWVPGFSFAVYGGVQCSAVGLDVADQRSEVERVFRLAEGKGVERALLENRFVVRAAAPGLSGPDDVEWDAPDDLTPATAVPLSVALALLEGHAAAVYAGQPTLHMSRAAASLLGSNYLVWEGDLLFTRLGSKVAMGGGYDSDTVPPLGEWDLYATGEVYVERSDLISINTYELNGSAVVGYPFDSNTSVALAERAYRAAVDCFVAKATGTVWS